MDELKKMTVNQLAVESENNKLMQGYVWTKAYDLEEGLISVKRLLKR